MTLLTTRLGPVVFGATIALLVTACGEDGPGGVGDPCADTVDCDTGLVCGLDGTCYDPGGGVGSPCTEPTDCNEGLFCGVDGTCYDPSAGDGDSDVDSDSDSDGDGDSDADGDLPAECRDNDGDGYQGLTDACPDGVDCNDNNDDIHPGAEEACGDRRDNNCNGEVDEEPCGCAPGTTQECYTGPADTAGRGICHTGRTRCQADGSLGDCAGEQLPAEAEECGNLVDDDCDGHIDEDCDCDPICRCDDPGAGPDCECSPPINQPCYSGPASTGSVGACEGGLRDCMELDDGTFRWGECRDEVLPSEEVCENEIDEDCDGFLDTGCGGGIDLDEDGYSVARGDCDDEDPTRNPGVEEDCNGFDDNCDGLVDEICDCTPPSEQVCYSGAPETEGVAACHAGSQTCEGGTEFRRWSECVGEVIPEVEVCDGVDNDCDGETDERWALGSNGCGECIFDETRCNGHDDDCDGLVDEGLVNACGECPPTACFDEAYEAPGECEHGGRECEGVGPWEDDATAVTLRQGSVRAPFLYIAVDSRNEVAQLSTETGEKNWQVSTHGNRPSRTAVAMDHSVWVANRCLRGSTEENLDPSCSNAVHIDIEGELICRADVPGVARGLAIDAEGNVWVGTWDTQMLYRVSGDMVDHTTSPASCQILDTVDVGVNVYGLAIDGEGYLWTASATGRAGSFTARVNTRDTSDITYVPNRSWYGIAIDADDRVWMGGHGGEGPVHSFDPVTFEETTTAITSVTGIAVSPVDGHIWGSQYNINQVVRIDPVTGESTCTAPISCGDFGISCSSPHGVAVLPDNTAWVPIRNGGIINVFDSDCTLLHVYEVDLARQLYTYSDMAGVALMTITTRQGHWVQNFDTGYDEPNWGRITWTVDPMPDDTDVEITLRASETAAGLNSPDAARCRDLEPIVSEPGPNDVSLAGCDDIQGMRWLQVDMELRTAVNGIRPVVRDLHLHWAY